jgi:hypothetical protein
MEKFEIEIMVLANERGKIKSLKERFKTTGSEEELEKFLKDIKTFIKNHE